MDTLGYVLFFRCRPRGDTPGYRSFEISSSARAYVRVNYEKKNKEENPSRILVVFIGETKLEVHYSLNTEELLDLLGKGGT